MNYPKRQLEKSPLAKAIIFAGVVIPFVATVYAAVLLWQQYIDARDLILMLTLYVVSGIGITVGYHRLLTHTSFETYKLIKALLLAMGAMALEGSPTSWASTHIEHHAHADSEDDPHSPLVNLWHAHVGWMFSHVDRPTIYGSWLRKDPIVVWIDRTWPLWAAFGLVIPFAIGGWRGLLWGGLVRICLTHHSTFSVNSICHTFGRRPYMTKDSSRNNWLVSLFAFGEGWHNNHHTFPRSAAHGLHWWQVDFSYYLIRGLELMHLAWNVRVATPEEQHKRAARAGHPGIEDRQVAS